MNVKQQEKVDWQHWISHTFPSADCEDWVHVIVGGLDGDTKQRFNFIYTQQKSSVTVYYTSQQIN